MYIYELPFDIMEELRRLLNNDEYWRELASHMKYTAFDISEIEQTARRLNITPIDQLFIKWGQLNHNVNELFILLYRMKHIPAMNSLKPVVNKKFHDLLNKHKNINSVKDKSNAIGAPNNSNDDSMKRSACSIPLPVVLIEKGVQLASTSKLHNGDTPTNESSMDSSKNTASTQSDNNDDEFIKNVSAIPKMSYEELREATNDWCETNLLGKGGFGQVFKGEWKHLPVAVKRLRDKDGTYKELIREMCLNQYRHDNILPLYGYSLGGPEECLVYQLMAGGSLEQRLRGRTQYPPLVWVQRYRVAHGVARGLQFLHNMAGTPLIHGDIKPANILLDQCSVPKIGDFGLARKAPHDEDKSHMKVSRVYGTFPYLPDEYLRSRCLSPAVDVYSYGVVMEEMATALHVNDRNRSTQLLSNYIYEQSLLGLDMAVLEDPVLRNTPNSNPFLCHEFVAIGLHCTRQKRQERPTMLDVYKRLDSLKLPELNYL